MVEQKTANQGNATVTQDSGSLLDQILAETKIAPSDDAYTIARDGLGAFIAKLLAPGQAQEKVDRAFVDTMIAEIDKKLSTQVDEILHHAEFQKLESAWRGLKFTVDRTDFRENIKIEMLNCSKADLM